MKEQYTPVVEPLKKGAQITAISAQAFFEAVKPRIERRMKRKMAEFLDLISGCK